MSHLVRLVLASLPLVAVACAPSSATPADVGAARVVVVYDEDVLLTGTTDGALASEKCAASTAAPKHVVQLTEPSVARVTLRATNGAAPLLGATLRVTNLASKETWCLTMKSDVAALTLPGRVPSGLYGVSVSEPGTDGHRYEVLWEQKQ